jgi:hypothetical protein
VDQQGEVFELPLSFGVEFEDRTKTTVSIAVTERSLDRRVMLAGPPRSVAINKDDGLLADISQ